MQDEVNAKMTGLAKESGKMSLRLLWKMAKKAVSNVKTKLTQARTKQTTKTPTGKTSVKKLGAQNKGMKSFELPETKDIAQFDRIMKRYGVDYAIQKNRTGETSKATVFFKGQDVDAFTLAFTEFAEKKMKHEPKPSVLKKMEKFQEQVKMQPQKETVKEVVR